MRLNHLIALLLSVLIACTPSAQAPAPLPPAAVPITVTQVVFRSPRDMNLQPSDVPELAPQAVDNPATAPLLPEAIDQDQLAYISNTQNIYIESNVIMVPAATKRAPREIVDEVVHKRRPSAHLDTAERPVSLGAYAALVNCNSGCGAGYNTGRVLLIIRNNVVVVLIGCGSGVTDAAMLGWGRLVDVHIIAPPQPQELAPSKPQPSVQATCDQLRLTAEELANCGAHWYHNIQRQVECIGFPPAAGGVCAEGGEFDAVFTFSFLDNARLQSSRTPDNTVKQFAKVSPNTWSASFTDANAAFQDTVTITFSLSGVTILTKHESAKYGLVYMWADAMTLLK